MRCATAFTRRSTISLNGAGQPVRRDAGPVGETDPAVSPYPPPLYAAACRWREDGESWRLETWAHTLTLGGPLPTLPLWLAEDLAVPLDLENTYEETCRGLRVR